MASYPFQNRFVSVYSELSPIYCKPTSMRASFNDGSRNHPRQLISTNNGVVGGGYGVRISLGYFIYRTWTSSLVYLKENEN